MSRLPGYAAIAAATLVFVTATTAVAVAAAQDETPAAPGAEVSQVNPPPAYPAVTGSGGYPEADSGHHQNRRGRGHGSRHGRDDSRPHR